MQTFSRHLAEKPDLNFPVVKCHMVQMHLENVKIKMVEWRALTDISLTYDPSLIKNKQSHSLQNNYIIKTVLDQLKPGSPYLLSKLIKKLTLYLGFGTLPSMLIDGGLKKWASPVNI